MKPVIHVLILLMFLCAIASCTPGGYQPPTVAVTSWTVNLKYINPESKEPIIGEGRYFRPSHLQILTKTDTGYRESFMYNHYAEPDSQRDDSYIIRLGRSVHTDITEDNENTDISGNISRPARFEEEYVIILKHAQATITDSFRLVKDTDDEFSVYLNGVLTLTAPAPTHYKDVRQLTIER